MNSPERLWNQTRYAKWKNWIILGLILAIVIILIIHQITKPEIPTPTDVTPILKKAEYFKDENDKLIAKMEQLVVTNAQARAYADSLAKALKLKPKFIKGVDQYVYKTDTIFSNLPVVSYKDKDTMYVIEKKDDYIDIQASIRTLGKGEIRFASKDTLTRTEVVKTNIWGKTTRKVYVRNANPYNTVNEGLSWTTQDKKAFLVVGPYLGYDPIQNKPSIGVAVTIPFIQLKK